MPKKEEPDEQEEGKKKESGGCKLNIREAIFLIISTRTAQILLSLLAI